MFSFSDIVHALRLLKKTPKFSASVILILAGGLAITLFTFQFVYGLMYKPVPLPNGEKLYRSGTHWVSETTGKSKHFPAWELAQVRDKINGVDLVSVWQNKTLHVSLGENNRVVAGVRAEGSLLNASGVQPIKGRTLQQSDSEPGQTPVAVIGYSLWKSQLGGREDVIGQVIYVNGIPTDVVGVMPQGFRFPISHDLWLPIKNTVLNPVISSNENVEVLLKLRDGVTPDAVQNQMTRLVETAFADRSAQFPGKTLSRAQVSTFHNYDINNALRIFLFTLNGTAVFILLLACINISNLLYARAIQRGKESAIRIAIGATRKRLILQLMWEGLIITFIGTLLAIVLTYWALNFFNVSMHSLMQGELAFWYVWEFDLPTLLAAIGFMLFVIYVACYTPARRAAIQDVNSALRDGTRGAQGKAAGRASRILVTVQIMLITIISLMGTVIALKVDRVIDADIGLDVSNTYFTMLTLPSHDYPEGDDHARFYDMLRQRVTNQPEVSATFVQFDYGRTRVAVKGVEYQAERDKPKAYVWGSIGDRSFQGPAILEGRRVDQRDTAENRKVANVSASFVKHHFAGESALGKQIALKVNDQLSTYTIIGITQNIAVSAFRPKDQRDEIYLSGFQVPNAVGTVFFRYSSEPFAAENAFFRGLASIDTGIDILTIEEYAGEINAIEKMAAGFRDVVIYSGLFSLLLAVSGIYSLTAYAVTRRTHEIGLRRALGARNKQIIGLFVSQSSIQLMVGLGIGILITAGLFFIAGKVLAMPMSVYLIVYTGVIFTLVSAVLMAVIIPTKQTLQKEPSDALRFE